MDNILKRTQVNLVNLAIITVGTKNDLNWDHCCGGKVVQSWDFFERAWLGKTGYFLALVSRTVNDFNLYLNFCLNREDSGVISGVLDHKPRITPWSVWWFYSHYKHASRLTREALCHRKSVISIWISLLSGNQDTDWRFSKPDITKGMRWQSREWDENCIQNRYQGKANSNDKRKKSFWDKRGLETENGKVISDLLLEL